MDHWTTWLRLNFAEFMRIETVLKKWERLFISSIWYHICLHVFTWRMEDKLLQVWTEKKWREIWKWIVKITWAASSSSGNIATTIYIFVFKFDCKGSNRSLDNMEKTKFWIRRYFNFLICFEVTRDEV